MKIQQIFLQIPKGCGYYITSYLYRLSGQIFSHDSNLSLTSCDEVNTLKIGSSDLESVFYDDPISRWQSNNDKSYDIMTHQLSVRNKYIRVDSCDHETLPNHNFSCRNIRHLRPNHVSRVLLILREMSFWWKLTNSKMPKL